MKKSRIPELAIPSFSPSAVQTPNARSSKNCCIFFINSIAKILSNPLKTFRLPELMPFYRLKIQLTNITGITANRNGLILIFLGYHCKKKPINLALQFVKNLLNQNP